MHPGQFRPDRKEKQRVNPVEKELTELLADERYGTFIQTIRKIRFPANYRFDSHAHPQVEINYINSGCCMMEVEERIVPPEKGKLHCCQSRSKAFVYGGCEQILCHHTADLPDGPS